MSQVAQAKALLPGGIIDLRGLGYGTPDGITEVWGDWRDNMLFGGQGEGDPVDGNETLHGGAGPGDAFAQEFHV